MALATACTPIPIAVAVNIPRPISSTVASTPFNPGGFISLSAKGLSVAYLSQKPELLGGVKGQDILKAGITITIILSVVLRLLHDFGWIGWDVLNFLTVQ